MNDVALRTQGAFGVADGTNVSKVLMKARRGILKKSNDITDVLDPLMKETRRRDRNFHRQEEELGAIHGVPYGRKRRGRRKEEPWRLNLDKVDHWSRYRRPTNRTELDKLPLLDSVVQLTETIARRTKISSLEQTMSISNKSSPSPPIPERLFSSSTSNNKLQWRSPVVKIELEKLPEKFFTDRRLLFQKNGEKHGKDHSKPTVLHQDTFHPQGGPSDIQDDIRECTTKRGRTSIQDYGASFNRITPSPRSYWAILAVTFENDEDVAYHSPEDLSLSSAMITTSTHGAPKPDSRTWIKGGQSKSGCEFKTMDCNVARKYTPRAAGHSYRWFIQGC
ncbi:MAG: hypothetical protein J3Q66DRAFT_375480 [Benniella sp.]|nr:MAG: hypothetical protein J3Q66DRAFT_375480 [Benniella sp.]